MLNKNVSAVVVTYNRLNLLKECVSALLNQTYEVKHLIIVNNNSNDGTEKYLETLNDDRIIIKNLQENIGGAAGFKYGIKQAYELFNDDLIWFMDDDTIANGNACEKLINAGSILNYDFGFLCSNARWTDGKGTNIPAVSDKWTDYADQGLVGVNKATFVSVMVTRKSLEQLGYPVSEMVIWGDDTEFTTRFSKKKPSFFVMDSIVIHKTKNNLSNDTLENSDENRIQRYFYLYRNLVFINRKYNGNYRMNVRILRNIKDFFKVLFHANSFKSKKLAAVLKGTISGLFFNPTIEYPKSKEESE